MESLMLCNKLFVDSTVLQLRQENYRLKRQLFWKNNGKARVKNIMTHLNYTVTNCGCVACGARGSFDEDDDFESKSPCELQREWDDLLNLFGFTVDKNGPELAGEVKFPNNDHDPSGEHYVNIDADFSLVARCDWVFWAFGRRLWNGNSSRLKKYEDFLDGIDCCETVEEYKEWKKSHSR